MLDNETKRRIDTCRDILVGKVPDPKSQVEQITIGLIYKFMDDMDAEAEELGGLPSFFVGEYDRFGWRKIFNPALGGHEMLSLYSEAITRLALNPNLPPLFRDIFKNAYLPYRDPETLKSFLKELDWFSYDHSEKLGDAFEYLLSVLGSQGDAGQFRTPRHIIDFIVALLDPKKNETIMDPACGTAGFLISAYKHILAKNSVGGESKLTPDERTRLTANIKGYDISPDMVRLSLVNLYLHGFAEPHIFEYDSLTSEDRWNEYADVFLANPPFMSPKGGIKPHKRFSVESNRSEVLFVDYMVEHLTPNGRAAIIVPEGVIFQSGTAYKALRKMLVDNQYLVGVISLPAGVFQPYSGVKTSILWIDRAVAKRTDKILFAKIEADGFDLGAQRKASKKNDLPDLLESLKEYIATVGHVEETEMKPSNPNISMVNKEEIGRNGEFVLSGERYTKSSFEYAGSYPKVIIGEVCEVQSGFAFSSELFTEDSGFPLIRIRDIKTNSTKTKYLGEYSNDFIVQNGDMIIGMDGEFNTVIWQGGPALLNQRVCRLQNFRGANKSYVFRMIQLKLKEIEEKTFAVTVKHISGKQIKDIEIPLPPLSIQEEIVAEIEGYQKIIDGARQVVENYKPRIDIDPEWEMVELGEVCEIKRGRFSHRPRNAPEFYGGEYPFIQTGDVVRAGGDKVSYTQTLNELGLSVSKLFEPPIVLITIAANIGDTALLDFPACFPDSVVGLIPSERIVPKYLELIMRSKQDYLNKIAPQAAQKNINIEILKPVEIPLPSFEIQKEIVSRIEKEQSLVNSNSELISIFEQKIKDRIAKVWGAHKGMLHATSKEPIETISIAAETASIYNV